MALKEKNKKNKDEQGSSINSATADTFARKNKLSSAQMQTMAKNIAARSTTENPNEWRNHIPSEKMLTSANNAANWGMKHSVQKSIPVLQKTATGSNERKPSVQTDLFSIPKSTTKSAQKYASTSDEIDAYLQDGKKLTKDELTRAKQIVSDYYKNDYKANDKSWTDDKQKQFEKITRLQNKTKTGAAFMQGIIDAMPGTHTIEKKASEASGKNSLQENRQDVKAQNNKAVIAGNLAGQTAKYALGSKVMQGVPVVGKATQEAAKVLSKIPVLNKVGADHIANVLGDTVLDVALDTVPRTIDNIASGKSASDVTENAAKNIGMNMAFNVLGEGIGTGIGKLIELKNAKQAAKDTADTVSDVAKQADNAEIPHLKNTEQSVEKPIKNRETVEDVVSKKNLTEAPNTNVNVNGATSNTVPVLHQNANDSFVNKTSEDLWGELEKGDLSRQQAQTDFGQHYENVQALKSDNPNMKVSQTATNTFRKSDLYQNQQFADMVENDIKSGKFNFESVSHEQAYERAGKELAQDYDGQTKRLLNAEWSKGSEDVAMAHLIKQQALETGDMGTVADMAWKTAEQAHKMGQGLEALKTYNATPEGTIQSAYNYSYNRVLKWEKKNAGTVEDMKQASDSLITALDMNETYKSIRDQVQEQFAIHKSTRNMGEDAVTRVTDMLANGESSDAIYNFLARYEAVGMDILDADTTEYVMKRVAEAEKLGDSKKGAEIMQDVYATMADKLGGASGMEKVNAWRYMCMLSSPTTHIANLAGNTSNYLLHHVSRDIQSALESIANTGEKTAAVLHITNKSDRNLLKQSRDYITNNAYSLYKGESRLNVKQGIDANKKVFGNKLAEGIRKLESNTLEKEDWAFIKLNGSEYLASYLKANGADASIFNATDAQSKQLLNKAIEYSSQKAKEATYHEASKLAELMGNFRETAENGGIIAKTGYTAVNATIPFASMTENYIKEGARYSPFQMVKAIAETAVPKLRKGITTSDLLEDYAQGLTGSAMVAAGVALASLGIINGSGTDDEEQKAFDELQGLQGYSLNFELNGKKYTYTLSLIHI